MAKPESVKDQTDECILDMKVSTIFMELLGNMEGSPYDESTLQTFLTPSGLRAHTSQVAACGDEVWIIYGTHFPVVLRSEQDGRYSFIIQALMCEGSVYNNITQYIAQYRGSAIILQYRFDCIVPP